MLIVHFSQLSHILSHNLTRYRMHFWYLQLSQLNAPMGILLLWTKEKLIRFQLSIGHPTSGYWTWPRYGLADTSLLLSSKISFLLFAVHSCMKIQLHPEQITIDGWNHHSRVLEYNSIFARFYDNRRAGIAAAVQEVHPSQTKKRGRRMPGSKYGDGTSCHWGKTFGGSLAKQHS